MLPPPQLQSHGGHDSPTRHSGQWQTHVSPHSLPPLPPLSPSHVQSHGGHVAPGAHGAQAQVHVPPPPGAQSQSHGGQSAPAGQ